MQVQQNMKLRSALDLLSPILGRNLSITRIPTALTNACYKVDSKNGSFALRLNYSNAQTLGIDRDRETQLLTQLKNETFWVPVTDCKSEWLLTQWLPSDASITGPPDYKNLFSAVHSIDVCELTGVAPLLVNDQIQRLLKYQKTPLNSELHYKIDKLCEAYVAPNSLSLCYHDWHPGNVVRYKGNDHLLDWEYAAPGDIAVDLACFVLGIQLDSEQEASLLRDYALEPKRYALAKHLTQLMSALWYGARFENVSTGKTIETLCEDIV
jgi:thiamine kinase